MTKAEYQKYLASPHWRHLKRKKAGKNGGEKRCSICRSVENIHLHHLFYRKDKHKTKTKELVWLCKECHWTAHRLIKEGLVKQNFTSKPARLFRRTKRLVKMLNGKIPME